MVQLEIPHVNVLTKMDLVRKKRSFMVSTLSSPLRSDHHCKLQEKFYQPDIDELIADLNADSNAAMYK